MLAATSLTVVVAKAPKWVRLHGVSSLEAAVPAAPAANDKTVVFELPGDLPPCSSFRIRFQAASAAPDGTLQVKGLQLVVSLCEAVVAAVACLLGRASWVFVYICLCLSLGPHKLDCLQIEPPNSTTLMPIGGGAVSGSGGCPDGMELCGPAQGFDDGVETRWVDLQAGGIGNVGTWQYSHTRPVLVSQYAIMSASGQLSQFRGKLAGAPRDWRLEAKDHAGKTLHTSIPLAAIN